MTFRDAVPLLVVAAVVVAAWLLLHIPMVSKITFDFYAMTRLRQIRPAAFGTALIALGLTVVIVDMSVRSCTSEWDVTICEVGSVAGLLAGAIVVAVGVLVAVAGRTTPAILAASALSAALAVTMVVLVITDPARGQDCFIGFHQPLLAPGQTPLPVPSLDENGMYCE